MSSYPDPSKKYPPIGLLAQAGFEQGDFLPLYTFNPNDNRSVAFTSTTWASDTLLSQCYVQWNELFPPDVTAQVMGQAYISVGAGETCDFRIRNIIDDETMAELTGVTSSKEIILGPTSYTPTTTDGMLDIRWQWKESPGANSTTIFIPIMVFGVEV